MKKPAVPGAILNIVGLVFIFAQHAEASYGSPYADCTFLKENENSTHYGGRCFCYSSGTGVKWRDFWSTFQVSVTGDEDVRLVYPMEGQNCRDPDSVLTLSKCVFDHYWTSSPAGEKMLNIPLVGQDVCFMVKSKRPSVQYTLHVSGKRLDRLHFGLFVTGAVLFHFAGTVCRSSLLYYTVGVSLGVVSILVFLLFMLKNVIPKRGLFLMLFGASSTLSYLGLQQLLAHWDEVSSRYWREALGYLVVSGLVSFAVCYKRGPIRDERALGLMSWVLQALAVGLMYRGITYPTAAYGLLACLLALKGLCILCRQAGWLLRSTLGMLGRRPRVRLLSEEEYREQGEASTRAALEALREHCTRDGFPAWDTVLRLRAPQRFADFLRGGSHLTPGEARTHDQQYGPGGAYFEHMIFSGPWGGPVSESGVNRTEIAEDLERF
ncbi:hypothetical protein AAFF_G00208910 [Aldrovandia affinis]|uniref:Nuclear envelope integral membrane protein 2 n=1 Tax=Aldrovandia affinis TaxID=143900 RepID=A0AAD7RHD9_9TELE|nr:hypothetical protein AAFF_G00208910 [Aldrovandia affinis]